MSVDNTSKLSHAKMNTTWHADKCYLLRVWISIISHRASVCLYFQATSPISPAWSNIQVIPQTKQDFKIKSTKKNLNQRVWVSLSNFIYGKKSHTSSALSPKNWGGKEETWQQENNKKDVNGKDEWLSALDCSDTSGKILGWAMPLWHHLLTFFFAKQ